MAALCGTFNHAKVSVMLSKARRESLDSERRGGL